MSGIRSLKSLAPRICPQCQGENTFSIQHREIICRRCGFAVRREDGYRMTAAEAVSAASVEVAATRPRYGPERPIKARYSTTHVGPVDNWAKAAFDTGIENVHRQNWEEAVKAFQRSIGYQHDFIDPHLWIARISNDPDEKREHLENVLAHQSNHLEALREMMILNGQLSARAAHLDEHIQPETREAGGAVGTETSNLRCDVCGSPTIVADEVTGLPVCQSCGAINERQEGDEAPSGGASHLTMALLQRRMEPVRWVIGKRLLHCDSCGAERTIGSGKLSDQCPFCGSTHVIERDVLDSFQQPDGVIPFRVNRQQAAEQIESRLGSWMERFKGWFDDNTVQRKTLTGIFLPFWMFDATVQVRISITASSDPYSRTYSVQTTETTLTDTAFNVPVCGVTSPSHLLTDKLGKYEMGTMKPYSPKLLAQFPAELYSIDFDKASLEARGKVNQSMREKHLMLVNAPSDTKVSIFPMIQGMEFQLVLMPVWVATLYEADGDVRTALVNGQTGDVALGKAKKPSAPH